MLDEILTLTYYPPFVTMCKKSICSVNWSPLGSMALEGVDSMRIFIHHRWDVTPNVVVD
jgi:hypothetical protein